MAWKKATEINLSQKQRKILEEYKKGSHVQHHLKRRAEIIVRASEGEGNRLIGRTMKLDPQGVAKWRNRYAQAEAELKEIEEKFPHKLRSKLIDVLSDEQRPGRPSEFTDEQVATILMIACEDPMEYGIPESHWTPRTLRQVAIEKKIVENISERHVGRFLKGARFATSSQPVLAKPKN